MGGGHSTVGNSSASSPSNNNGSRHDGAHHSIAVVGLPAPHFSMEAVLNGDFVDVRLSRMRGRYVVLFFYPNDFTFLCPAELIAFSDNIERFQRVGCEVIGCSCDSQWVHLNWLKVDRNEGGLGPQGLRFPLAADPSGIVARSYGIYNSALGNAKRALFVIDRSSTLRHVTINDDQVGRHVDEVLRVVQAFQATDESGGICPISCTNPADTIQATQESVSDYLSHVGGAPSSGGGGGGGPTTESSATARDRTGESQAPSDSKRKAPPDNHDYVHVYKRPDSAHKRSRGSSH